eukprot:14733796-Alexandrium_andersonii.AAC.1
MAGQTHARPSAQRATSNAPSAHRAALRALWPAVLTFWSASLCTHAVMVSQSLIRISSSATKSYET